jgi:hypothetical protein
LRAPEENKENKENRDFKEIPAYVRRPFVSTPAAADWDASFTVERINF